MAVSGMQRARLCTAALRLHRAYPGVVPDGAVDSPPRQWSELFVNQIIGVLSEHRGQLDELGVDTALLPLAVETAAPWGDGTVRGEPAPQPDWSVPDDLPIRTAAEVLADDAAGGEDLHFDGSLDGLRGVPVVELDGVGERLAQRFHKAGIDTVHDLLLRVPLRYVDRTQLTPLAAIQPGMREAAFFARVQYVDVNQAKRYVRITVGDNGRKISIMYFNAMWMGYRFSRDDLVIVQGDIGEFNGSPSMSNAIMERVEAASAPLMPIYKQSAKHQVNTWQLRRAAVDALRRIPELHDPVPAELRSRRQVMARLEALQAVHLPDTSDHAARGRERLAYDELYRLQLALGVLRNAQAAEPGVTHKPTGKLTGQWRAALPFALTGAQERAIAAVKKAMTNAAPASVILQGDVGSGKTKCLVEAGLVAIEGGYQVALLAPTEILARQHYAEIAGELAPLGLNVDLLVSKNLPRPKKAVLADLADGTCNLVVGTHSLIEDSAVFHKLGLALIDEQHRFGVDQRAKLAAKGPGGAAPDLVQATATPIPRTAAITTYGDLELAILDEKPPGRSPIDTRWVYTAATSDADAAPWRAIREQVAEGRQAFVVCPRVVVSGKESETKQAAAAEQTRDELAEGALAGLRIGLATGKQKPDERAATMDAFTAGDLDVLVATTVIEVGVSVKNATGMVILDASNFGLAQLHQLRGRVGRGEHAGQCWLVADKVSEVGEERLNAMVATDDGFRLAEMDLAIRGPGSLTGTAQAGKEAGLQVADLIGDAHIHLAARQDARHTLARDPQLLRNRALRTEIELALGDDAHYLTKG